MYPTIDRDEKRLIRRAIINTELHRQHFAKRESLRVTLLTVRERERELYGEALSIYTKGE